MVRLKKSPASIESDFMRLAESISPLRWNLASAARTCAGDWPCALRSICATVDFPSISTSSSSSAAGRLVPVARNSRLPRPVRAKTSFGLTSKLSGFLAMRRIL